MIYSQIYLKNQTKVPTIVAVLIACFVGLLFLRLFSQTPPASKAEKKALKLVEVTNLSPNQVAVYWQTDQKSTGWVIYGTKENELNKIANDERDISTKKSQYLYHYTQLKNLNENQVYFFKLVSNNKLIVNTDDKPFSFNTPKNVTPFKGREPAYGKVIKPNGSPLENTVVLIHMNNVFSFSALTKSIGEWLIPINSVFEKKSYQPRNPTSKEQATIEILNEDGQMSTVMTDLSKVSPVPQTIIIGSNLNFTSQDNILSATSSQGNEGTTKEIDIIYPQENKMIPGYSPLIKGVAIPNEEVMIEVHSETAFSSKVKTDEKGEWKLNLPSNLSPGEHTITIRTKDKNGNVVIIERKFNIAKIGEQVLGTATPEGTITTAPATPTPTRLPIYSPTPKPPVSGGSITTPLVGAASFIILGLGLILVF